MSLILRTLRSGGLINKNILKASQSQRTLFGNKFDASGSDKAKRQEEDAQKAENSTTTPPPSADQAENSNSCEKTAEIERLTAEIEKLQADKIKDEQKNKLQLADLINTNKRVAERHEKELKYAPKKFAKSMLGAYDDLQRAIDHAPKKQ